VDALSAKYMVPIRRGIMSVFMMRDGTFSPLSPLSFFFLAPRNYLHILTSCRNIDYPYEKGCTRSVEPDISEVRG
jgi:hypothetical protein